MTIADTIAATAHWAMMTELATFPKPGLVSHVDRGSHVDMGQAEFRASADAIRPFLARLAEAGAAAAPLPALRTIGLKAETAMLDATGGVNTHRGAIFGLGLLCAASGARHAVMRGHALGAIVRDLWGDAILATPPPTGTNGAAAARRHGVGGARVEAALGFPTIGRVALPALEAGRALAAPGDEDAARVHAFFALLADTEDTNLLHRGGAAGAAWAREEARGFLRAGGVGAPSWRDTAARLHRAFVNRRLSPGGCADLLAMALFVEAMDDGNGPRAARRGAESRRPR